MTTRQSKKGFGIIESSHFTITIPKNHGNVTLMECLNGEVSTRSTILRDHWDILANHVQANFNQRLKSRNCKTAKWKLGENHLERMLGKEITLLAWAVESAQVEQVPAAVMNWIGLAPEERWWLYTTANATRNFPGFGPQQGWRKAIRIAFAENPVYIPSVLTAGR